MKVRHATHEAQGPLEEVFIKEMGSLCWDPVLQTASFALFGALAAMQAQHMQQHISVIMIIIAHTVITDELGKVETMCIQKGLWAKS